MRQANRRWWKLAVVAVVTAVEVLAEEKQPSRRRIVVSIPDRKLALIEDGRVVKVYRTAVGAAKSPSPTGTFLIVTRVPNPAHYVPGKITLPGPANPVGTRWIGLSIKGFGIHGTNVPRSIGKAASHGCIRMRNSDIEELFGLVSIGDVVELRGERDAEAVRLFGGAAPAVAAGAGD